MLTDKGIKAMRPESAKVTEADSGGLAIEVHPTGRKTFKLWYRFLKKQRTVTIGEYPAMKLAAARIIREQVKAMLSEGHDPKEVHCIRKRRAPVEDVSGPDPADTWQAWTEKYLLKRKRENAAAGTIKKLTLHAKVTFATMGDKPIRDIGAQDVIAACQRYEEQGMANSAHAVRALCGQVFRFAIAHGAANHDPASPTRDALARPQNIGYRGITEPARVGDMMRALRAFQGEPPVRAALLLSAYLFPRNGEIRQMEWSQIKGDVWEVPAEAMKKNRPHVVPLPRQARQVLAWIKPYSGQDRLVMPSRTSACGLLSGNTLNQVIRRLGFPKEEHCHHGFRITASTTLHEQGFNSDWIERQLAHVEENKIKGAYNKALYLEDRKGMMQWYADWLDAQEATA